MANNFFNNYQQPNYSQPPMFLQPQGNVYVINNSMEVANVPMGSGISIAVCPSEQMAYFKMYQNGAPSMVAYKLIPYENKKEAMEDELNKCKQKIAQLEKLINKEVKSDESTIDSTF